MSRTPTTTRGVPDRFELAAFEEWLRSWGAAESTIRQRLSVLGQAVRDTGRSDPAAMTTDDLVTWLAVLGSQWTKVSYVNHLRSYFGWMSDSGRLPTNPAAALRVPKSPKNRPRPLTPTEVDKALQGAEGHLRLWLLLGLLAGLRAHESAKIRGSDVSEEEIFVCGKGNKEAVLPTHPLIWAMAGDYPRRGYWFPSRGRSAVLPHVAATWVTTCITQHFSALGIEGSSHRLRHTYATNLLRSGANVRVVQELMRHDSLTSTAKYTQVDRDEMSYAIGRLDPRGPTHGGSAGTPTAPPAATKVGLTLLRGSM